MIRLISYDEEVVEFSKEMAQAVPYIKDAFWHEGDLDKDQELFANFASGAQLVLLKTVLQAKLESGASYLPKNGKIRVGNAMQEAPPFTSFTWHPQLNAIYNTLTEDEIIDLLYIADDMCAWGLRKSVLILMIQKIVMEKMNFRKFFHSHSSRLKEILDVTYRQILTNGVRNGYYDHQGNNHSV